MALTIWGMKPAQASAMVSVDRRRIGCKEVVIIMMGIGISVNLGAGRPAGDGRPKRPAIAGAGLFWLCVMRVYERIKCLSG